MKRVEESLPENQRTFVVFARSRLGSPELAEDVVQESLVKSAKLFRFQCEQSFHGRKT